MIIHTSGDNTTYGHCPVSHELMGHRAMTVCCIIAGRVDNHMNTDYKGSLEKLIETVLDRI